MARQIPGPRKQRTRQHVIADQSVNHVKRFIIDEGHTAQELERDYGYDLLLFTYDEQGYVEPDFVRLQLKAAGARAGDRSAVMKRAEVTYGQLDKVLRLLGFSCRLVTQDPPARVYEHKQSEASIILPAFPESDGVLDYHLVAVRTTLDLNG